MLTRELARNRGQRGYCPNRAHAPIQQRRWLCPQACICSATWAWAEQLLRQGSPEQVSGHLRCWDPMRVSHESICQHIC